MRTRLPILGVAALLLALNIVGANAQSATTVRVNCNRRDSIIDAIERHRNVQELIVEIEGMCRENVILTRDRVILRGTSPATDGIQAVANTSQIDAALWVRGAHLVTVENLKLTGGFTGLLATDVNTPWLTLINSRLESNSAYGMVLENSLVLGQDTVLHDNGNSSAGVFAGSRLQCVRCTMSDPRGTGPLGSIRNNIIVFQDSSILLTETTLINGGIGGTGANLLLIDSTIGGNIGAAQQSHLNMTRGQLNGLLQVNQNSGAILFGVSQSAGPPSPNVVDDSSFVKVGDAPPASGGPPSIPSSLFGFNLRNFSNFSLFQNSQINGNLNCQQGANAFCGNPAKVGGTSNCGLCPKP
jgi:hypothetical protein